MKAFRWFFINACFAVLVISGLFVIGNGLYHSVSWVVEADPDFVFLTSGASVFGVLYLVFLFFSGGRL